MIVSLKAVEIVRQCESKKDNRVPDIHTMQSGIVEKTAALQGELVIRGALTKYFCSYTTTKVGYNGIKVS